MTGAIGYAVKRRRKGKVRIVRNGVWVDTVALPYPEEEAASLRIFDSLRFPPALLAAVESERLGFDLSGEKVLRNQELGQVKQIVLDAQDTTADPDELQLQLEDKYRALASGPLDEILDALLRSTLLVQPLAIVAAVVVFSALCGLAAVLAMLVLYVLHWIAEFLAMIAFAVILMEAIFGLYLAWALGKGTHGAVVARLLR